MDEDRTTIQTKWRLVEVKGPLEKIPCTDSWTEHGLPEKIEGEFGLGQYKTLKVWGKCGNDASQYCKEVVLECVNSALSLVAVMHIWQNKLELGFPLESDGILVCCAGFVVKDLKVN
jgi:hypothetical protein